MESAPASAPASAAASPSLQAMPTELQEKVFSLIRHPHSLALTCRRWHLVSTTRHVYSLWLDNHASWVDATLANLTWAPRNWGPVMSSSAPRLSSPTSLTPRRYGWASSGWPVRDEEPLPRLVATDRQFVVEFIKKRGIALHPVTGSHVFLWGAGRGDAEIVRLILLLDVEGASVKGSSDNIFSAIPHVLPIHANLRTPRIASAEVEAAFFRAADAGHEAVLQALLSLRPDGCKRLHLAGELAARRGHCGVLEHLLLFGAWDPGRDPRSQALLLACEGGHAHAVRLLLKYGYVGKTGVPRRLRTTGAAAGGGAGAGFGAGLNSWSDKCISVAARNGDLEVLKALLEGGLADDSGQGRAEAERSGHLHILGFLKASSGIE
ncbi:hypothetical protein HK104_000013 [Borealophlyctis nickersoniae]|nr:hypothetical protein HK104_000013 [Borealophlyctis nickersoniae]